MKFIGKYLMVMAVFLGMASCIGDDFVIDNRDPEVRITTLLESLEVNTSFQFEYMYLNEVGNQESLPVTWSSSDDSIATVSADGLVTGVSVGDVTITAEVDNGTQVVSDSVSLTVGMSTEVSNVELSGTIRTTSSYKLRGSFTLSEIDDNNLSLSFGDDYCSSSALPGLYIYLSNNRNTIANAFEIGEVTDFDGAHEYEINGVGLMDYSFIVYFCKPFNVKVGDGEIQ